MGDDGEVGVARPPQRRRRPVTPGERPRLPRVAGLDGFRGVMLVAVLAFHQGFDWMGGGFLAISSFGTLSGFLVATLLLAEWAQSGRVGLGEFWERRARRLLPTVLVVLGAAVVLQTTLRVGAGPAFRGDVLAAAAQGLNWRYALGGDGFTNIFTDPSPVQHLWAVGMQVQIALAFPLVFVALMTLARRAWRLTGLAFAALAVGSFVVAATTAQRAGNDSWAYYGTHARVGEVLVGVVLAYAVLSPTVRRLVESPGGAVALRFGAPAALVALAVLWHATTLHDDRLFAGITAVNALLTAGIVLAVTVPGPTGALLGARPLRVLGTVSYAAYVIHWPVYLVLDDTRLDVPEIVLFGARVAATLLLAAAATWALERPFRSVSVSRPQLAAAFATAAAVIAVAVVVLPQQPPRDVSMTIDNGVEAGDLDVVVPTGGDEAATIAVVGDGLAGSTVAGFEAWNEDHPDSQVRVHTHVADDCGIADAGPVRLGGRTVGEDTVCIGWEPRLPELLEAAQPDAIVVVGGVAELGQREIDREWRHVGDPVYDDWLVHRLDELAATLSEPGVPVVWATQPHVRIPPAEGVEGDWTTLQENDPARVDRLNEVIARTVGRHEGFALADLDAWGHARTGGEFGDDVRLEGRDLTPEAARAAVGWLVPQVLDATGPSADEGPGAGDGTGD